MMPGDFTMPAEDIVLTWSDPKGGEVERTVPRTEPVAFGSVLPKETEDLDPFVASRSLELAAKVRGVSTMFLPPVLPRIAIGDVAACPKEPVLAKTSKRGGGTRSARVTRVAEGG